MNLSYAISYESTKFEAIGQGNWKKLGRKMADLGYHGIELGIRDPFNVDVKGLEKFLTDNSLKLVAIGTGQVYFDGNCSLSSFDDEKRKKARAYLTKYIELAVQFKAMVIIGLIRGRLSDHENKKKALALWKSNIKEVDVLAAREGVTIIIEPINRYETDYLNSVQDVITCIEENNLKNTGLLFDTFHANIEEPSFEIALQTAKPFLKHIHFADSNRNFPGSGHIDFTSIVSIARDMGYEGFFSGEMRPHPDLDTSIKNYMMYMSNLKSELAKKEFSGIIL